MRGSVGGFGIAATMVVSLVGMPAASAAPSSGQVVVVHGTELPSGGAQLSFVGCGSLAARRSEQLRPYVGIGPATPPLGTRSLGYDLAGGDAVGALAWVPRIASAAATSISVYAPDGTTGVAYAGFASPAQLGTGRMWIGRAPLSVPAGDWTTVSTTGLSYTWTQVDVTTGAAVTPSAAAPTGTARTFAAAQHGVGDGFLTLGFGCDGHAFDLDAMRVGATTYDFEGLDVSATVSASATSIKAGGSVTLTGSLRDSSGAYVPAGTLTLEARSVGGDWHTVQVVDASSSDPSVVVRPDATTEYRFTSPERDLADATSSEPVTVTVADPSDGPNPSDSPSPSKSAESPDSPSAPSSTPASPTRTATPSSKPASSVAPKPSSTPTSTPSPTATASPTQSATTGPSPSATPATASSTPAG